jgi:LPXTG-motif cell wall-anchored protein
MVMRFARSSAVLLSSAVLVWGVNAGIAQAQQAQQVQVTLADYSISPNPIRVTAGTPVRFAASNTGQFPHDVRIDVRGTMVDVATGDANVMPGNSATLEYTFSTPGTYTMWCPVGSHRARGMEGQVVVAAAAGAPAAAAPAAQRVAQVPSTLPRTGDPATILAGLLAAAGASLAGVGLVLRRRRGE